ncbi:MAG: PAS domain S-box protein [Bacteroidota bacterium]
MADILSNKNSARNTGNTKMLPGMQVAENTINGFFTVDREWTVTYWNKAAEKLLGVEASAITGKNLWEEFAGIIPLDFYAVYDKAFKQDEPAYFEEYWGEMGAWFDVITYYSDNSLAVSFKNSSRSTNTQRQLKSLGELYKFVTEISNDCLWEWDLLTKEFFWIDGGHKRVFGYAIENALIPQSFWERRIDPADKARVLSVLDNILAGHPGSEWDLEYRFRCSSGRYAYVHDRGHIFYAEGRAVRMVGATQDITHRKEAEMQLLEAEKKLSFIAKQTINAVIIMDGDEKITWVNAAFTLITEYEPSEVIGKTPGSFLYGQDTDPLTIDYLKKKVEEMQPFDCNIIYYSKTGRKRWMHVQGQCLIDENGSCSRLFSIETDITERKSLEDKLAEAGKTRQTEITNAVLTAQENERSDMGKELHDNLNQVLGATKLYIEMAKTSPENRDIYLDRASGYIVNVIEEIRMISKTLMPPGIGVLGLFDSIRILLDDMTLLHGLEIVFDKHNVEEAHLDEKLRINIFRIIQEQMNNIAKHAGATVAAIHLSRKADDLTLMIEDNGDGADTTIKMNGSGLRNIMSRAELCRGKATIKSSPGKGFQLIVILPFSAAPDDCNNESNR